MIKVKALILTDLQNDFLPFGMQPYSGIENQLSKINELVLDYDLVVATQLWFPATHQRFASNHPWRHPGGEVEIDGVIQPLFEMYCIQHTMGATLLQSVKQVELAAIFNRGADATKDIDSIFYDKNNHSTGLLEFLQDQNVTEFDLFGVNHLNTFGRSIAVGEEHSLKGKILM